MNEEPQNIGLTIYLYGGGSHRTALTRSQALTIRGHLEGFLSRSMEERKGECFFFGCPEGDFFTKIYAPYIVGYATSEISPPTPTQAELEHRKLVATMTEAMKKASESLDEGEDWKEGDKP